MVQNSDKKMFVEFKSVGKLARYLTRNHETNQQMNCVTLFNKTDIHSTVPFSSSRLKQIKQISQVDAFI